jgi:hypothetical protein
VSVRSSISVASRYRCGHACEGNKLHGLHGSHLATCIPELVLEACRDLALLASQEILVFNELLPEVFQFPGHVLVRAPEIGHSATQRRHLCVVCVCVCVCVSVCVCKGVCKDVCVCV